MKTLFQFIIFFVVCTLFAFNTFASVTEAEAISSGNYISGKIIDQVSETPMEYVTVALYKSADSSLVSGAITDPEGNFKIEKIDVGSYYLLASFIGYENKRLPKVNITKQLNKADLGTIELEPKAAELNEVKVVGEKSKVEYKIDKRIVNVDKDIAAKGGTAIQALENTPSVQVDGQGNLTLRGSSDYIVLIDGKPSIVKGSDALKQIPSNAIKQIEVITNPSAKYEADGQGGIINVIMKKEMLQGLNGSLSAAWGNTDKATANANVNYRMKKVNIFAGFDFADNTYSDHIDITSKLNLDWGNEQNLGKVKEFSMHQNLGFRAGIDWDVNSKDAFSLGGGVSKQGYDNGNDANTSISNSLSTNPQYTKSTVYLDVTGMVYNLNLDYTHKFADNQKLMITNNLSTWTGRDQNDARNYYTNQDYTGDSIAFMNRYVKDNHNYTYRLNIDYNGPLFSGEVEAGTQFRYEPRFDDLTFSNYIPENKTWVENDSFSYILNYKNTIYSGYLTYSDKIWGIGYKIGLRSEYFMRSMDLDKEEAPLVYNKFMFYPSVHLSKEFNEKNSMQASYSRRINRPQPWLLNTTPRFIDTRNIFLGSPYLIPEYTDAFELNYRNVGGKLTTYIQTYFRNTINSLTAVRQMHDDGIMYHQLANSKSTQSFGAEMGGDLKLSSWWTLNANVNLFNYKQTTTISNFDKVQQIVTWDGRLVNNLNFKTGTRIQATGYYHAPSVDAVGKISGYYVVNLAVSQLLLKGAMNISLSGQNLIPNSYTYSVKGNNFDNKYEIGFEGPTFMVNLSYNFNNFQNKQRGRSDDLQFGGGGGF
jgi:outer membrane receptor protein involved in Fe transport